MSRHARPVGGEGPERALAKVARRQHGAWSRTQAVQDGFTRSMIATRLRTGTWIRLDEGVYAHAVSEPTWERSVMAAILAEPWAVASHRTAAVLHHIPGFRPGRPEITVRPGANARGRLAVTHRGVDVQSTSLRGILCSTLPQAFVDLAQIVGVERLQPALGAVADAKPEVLEAVRGRYCELAPRGGRDLRALHAVLDSFGAGDQVEPSVLERRLRSVLDWPGIPAAEWEAPFPGREPGACRVDGLIVPWRLVVEADGRTWHTRVQDFERDRRRDAAAAASGHLTLRFTWHQLMDEPMWVRGTVLAAGAHRTAA